MLHCCAVVPSCSVEPGGLPVQRRVIASSRDFGIFVAASALYLAATDWDLSRQPLLCSSRQLGVTEGVGAVQASAPPVLSGAGLRGLGLQAEGPVPCRSGFLAERPALGIRGWTASCARRGTSRLLRRRGSNETGLPELARVRNSAQQPDIVVNQQTW